MSKYVWDANFRIPRVFRFIPLSESVQVGCGTEGAEEVPRTANGPEVESAEISEGERETLYTTTSSIRPEKKTLEIPPTTRSEPIP